MFTYHIQKNSSNHSQIFIAPLGYDSVSQPGTRGPPGGPQSLRQGPRPRGPQSLRRGPRPRPGLNSQACFSIEINWPYFCESGFSDLVTTKTEFRNHLDVHSDIRLAVSKTEPNTKGLVRRCQKQVLQWWWLCSQVYVKFAYVYLLRGYVASFLLLQIDCYIESNFVFYRRTGGHLRVMSLAGGLGPKRLSTTGLWLQRPWQPGHISCVNACIVVLILCTFCRWI